MYADDAIPQQNLLINTLYKKTAWSINIGRMRGSEGS